VGTGGASKEQVLAAVRLNIEYLANEHERDQDIIDAAAICIHGRSVVEGLEALRVV
jgi:Holliday junction resolvasome RuvABC endonuclease subunit